MTAMRLLDGRVTQFRIPVHADARGRLFPLEFPVFGFVPVRAFLVKGGRGVTRGGHGHLRARQLLMAVSGEIEVELRHGGHDAAVRLQGSDGLVLIEPMVWSRQTYLGADAALMVFSDRHFDRADYFEQPDQARGP